MIRTCARRAVLRLTAAAVVLAGVAVPTGAAHANHIRAMVVTQSDMKGLTVTLRVDYHFSGLKWGGSFDFYTGETLTPQRHGAVEDGIEDGKYVGDIYPTPVTRSFDGLGSGTFSYLRRKLPAADIVRLEITYTYASAGVYPVVWSDCCPWSDLVTFVAAGLADSKTRILTSADSPNIGEALQKVGILSCTEGGWLCYKAATLAELTTESLNGYRLILVGDDTPSTVTDALTAREALHIKPWLDGGGRGIVQYGQTLGASWTWIPKPAGDSDLNAIPDLSNVVEPEYYPGIAVTPQGSPVELVAHRSYLNQLRSTAATPSTLSGWLNSESHHFNVWPGYMTSTPATDGVVARDAGGAVVSLAAPYPPAAATSPPSCVFASGQPIVTKAFEGNPAAQQVLRSSIAWALTCGPGFGEGANA